MVESNCKAIVIERIIYLTNIALATVYAILTPYVQILIHFFYHSQGIIEETADDVREEEQEDI